MDLMANSELGSPDSDLSFLVTICLSRLVSEIFARDRQTNGQTTSTITIAGPHVVAGQLTRQAKSCLTVKLQLMLKEVTRTQK